MAAPPKPSVKAFSGRSVDVNTGGFSEPVTKFASAPKDDANGRRHSSFPHLTPATPTRAEHLTDVTHIDTVVGSSAGKRFNIHQRFHQDNVVGSKPVFDRFIATDSETGRIHTATAALSADVHQGKNAAPPARDTPLEDSRRHALTFTVSDAATDDPPLSPRTRTRKVPDGY